MEGLINLFIKLFEVLEKGTYPVMVPLLVVCFGISVLTVNRMFYLYDPRSFIGFLLPASMTSDRREQIEIGLHDFLEDPSRDNRLELIQACQRWRTPYTRFLEDFLYSDYDLLPTNTLELQIDKYALEQELAIERGMQMLSTLAKAAPLMGLMGTVTGMIATFSAMMIASTSDPKALSSGISIALIATNVGLIVSVPGIVAMGVLSQRGLNLIEKIRLASTKIRGLSDTIPRERFAA